MESGDLGYNPNTTHGIIAAPTDQSTGAEWGVGGILIAGSNGSIIGTGNQNTIDFMASNSVAGFASRICGDLVLNGYNDWYLPSIDELYKLYENRALIGGFSYASYWSSTQSGYYYACMINFNNGVVGSMFGKADPYYVRAVRSF